MAFRVNSNELRPIKINFEGDARSTTGATNEFQANATNTKGMPNVDLNSLDDYSLLNILDHLTLEELINVTNVNVRFRALIIAHSARLKLELHEVTVRFISDFSGKIHDGDVITITRSVEIQRFLQYFGHFVSKVEFYGRGYNDNELLEISQSIEKYCATTLIEFEQSETGNYLTRDTNRVFSKITNLHLRQLNNQSLYDLQIHRIYPALEQLTLAFHPFIKKNATYFHQIFSNQVKHLLGSIPKLSAFHINPVPSLDLIRSINVIEPNLKSLAIGYDSNDFILRSNNNRNVHFHNVNNFKLNVFGDRTNSLNPFPITFDRLDSLEIVTMDVIDVPTRLIEQNVALKSLSLPYISQHDNLRSIFNLIERLQNLEKITLEWCGDLSSTYLMDQLDQLNEIVFIARDIHLSKNVSEVLKSAIPSAWNVANLTEYIGLDYKEYRITIIRKANGQFV